MLKLLCGFIVMPSYNSMCQIQAMISHTLAVCGHQLDKIAQSFISKQKPYMATNLTHHGMFSYTFSVTFISNLTNNFSIPVFVDISYYIKQKCHSLVLFYKSLLLSKGQNYKAISQFKILLQHKYLWKHITK